MRCSSIEIEVHPGRAVVFDLDDTLFKECDFVDSGFRATIRSLALPDDETWVARMWEWQKAGQPALDNLARELGRPELAAQLMATYRFHEPAIGLSDGVQELLEACRDAGARLGVVTDGRSRTQRAKLRALGLDRAFAAVVVSEEVGSTKPNVRNFQVVLTKLGGDRPVYIADNVAKDFLGPNRLGWTTIQLLDDGRNIHPAVMPAAPSGPGNLHHTPDFAVESLRDIRVKAASCPAG